MNSLEISCFLLLIAPLFESLHAWRQFCCDVTKVSDYTTRWVTTPPAWFWLRPPETALCFLPPRHVDGPTKQQLCWSWNWKIQWRRHQEGSNPLWTSTQVNPVHFTVHSYWRFSTGQSLSKLLSISKVQLWGELKRKTLTIYQCNFGHRLTTKCKNMLEHIDHTAAVFYITFFSFK